MSTLILTDIHGNLPALEAILSTPEARACGDIISLGDYVNYGPQSREVYELLKSLGAAMLLGNHEERMLRASDSAFSGYNWALMRWTARQMEGIDLALPMDLRRGRVLFTHATPGQPYHLVSPDGLADVLAELPAGVDCLVSGHNHQRWDVSIGHKRAFNPGSVGLEENDRGGIAPFAVLDGETLTHHEVAYDVRRTLLAYANTGAAAVAPEMCRMVARVMLTGEVHGIENMMSRIAAYGSVGDPASWAAADRALPWPEPISSAEYWRSF